MAAGFPVGLLLSLTGVDPVPDTGPGGVGSPMGLLLALTVSVAPPTPTPTPTTTTVTEGGAGRAAWRDHYEPYYKKRKKDLEALNEALLELRAKVAEQKIAEKAAAERSQIQSWINGLRSAEVFLANAEANKATLNAIANELARVHEALQEIEDEESIVLLLN